MLASVRANANRRAAYRQAIDGDKRRYFGLAALTIKSSLKATNPTVRIITLLPA
jgi:hypothetical protein